MMTKEPGGTQAFSGQDLPPFWVAALPAAKRLATALSFSHPSLSGPALLSSLWPTYRLSLRGALTGKVAGGARRR